MADPSRLDSVRRSVVAPSDLEDLVLGRGPGLYGRLLREAGGFGEAATLGKTSSQTLSRWAKHEAGVPFGAPHIARTTRSLWFGYPPPMPAMDRVTEELMGPSMSFVRALSMRYGLAETIRMLRSPKGYGLELLDFEDAEVREAASAVGLPKTTTTRLIRGLTYPRQWTVLDRLSRHFWSRSWLELVLSPEVRPVPQTIPDGALVVLIDVLLRSQALQLDRGEEDG